MTDAIKVYPTFYQYVFPQIQIQTQNLYAANAMLYQLSHRNASHWSVSFWKTPLQWQFQLNRLPPLKTLKILTPPSSFLFQAQLLLFSFWTHKSSCISKNIRKLRLFHSLNLLYGVYLISTVCTPNQSQTCTKSNTS